MVRQWLCCEDWEDWEDWEEDWEDWEEDSGATVANDVSLFEWVAKSMPAHMSSTPDVPPTLEAENSRWCVLL